MKEQIIEPKAKLRCRKCKKLLAKSSDEDFEIEIKCKKCGTFNLFLERLKDQLIITDLNGEILFVNQALVDNTMYDMHEIIGSTPSLWGGQMPKKFYKKLWADIKDKKKTVVVRLTNKRKNGETYEASLRISPVINVNGEIEFFVGIETILT